MLEKNIIQICINLNDEHPVVKNALDTFKSINSDWSYNRINSQEELDDFMITECKNSSDDVLRQAYETYLEIPNVICGGKNVGEVTVGVERFNIQVLVSKIDIVRWIWVYKNGGIFIDLDTEIKIPLSSIIKYPDKLNLTYHPAEVWNGIIYAPAGNKSIRNVIKIINDNVCIKRIQNLLHSTATGPVSSLVLKNMYENNLFDNVIKNPHSKRWCNMWDEISKNDLITKFNNLKTNDCYLFQNSSMNLSPNWKKYLYRPTENNPKINNHWFYDGFTKDV